MAWKMMCGGVALAALASFALNSDFVYHDYHGTAVSAAERSGKPGPQLSGCPVFPADNVWNTPLDHAPRSPQSDVYVARIGPDKALHPDFGPENGIPFSVIHANTKRVKVNFDYRDDSDLGNYPIPSTASIEGGPNSDGDRHVILIDQDRCLLFELWNSHSNPDGTWNAGSGVKMDLTDNLLRPDGKTSADAAGLAIFPGLIRYEEVATGEIRHALRFTVPQTQRASVWPARHVASKLTEASYPPMGTRFRLKKDVDISSYSKENQVILTALKRYGMLLADNGGPWFISGVPDRRWSDFDLNRLKQIKGSDFEAVDESDWQLLIDSGRVDPLSQK